jgi:hypothetical protein
MYETDRRPGVVTAASVILYVAAGIVILAGFVALGAGLPSNLTGLIWLEIGLAVLTIVLATKILGGSNGARITVIVLQSVNVALAFVGGLQGTDILGIGMNLLVIGLLAWNRDAQDYFNGERRERIERW